MRFQCISVPISVHVCNDVMFQLVALLRSVCLHGQCALVRLTVPYIRMCQVQVCGWCVFQSVQLCVSACVCFSPFSCAIGSVCVSLHSVVRLWCVWMLCALCQCTDCVGCGLMAPPHCSPGKAHDNVCTVHLFQLPHPTARCRHHHMYRTSPCYMLLLSQWHFVHYKFP